MGLFYVIVIGIHGKYTGNAKDQNPPASSLERDLSKPARET